MHLTCKAPDGENDRIQLVIGLEDRTESDESDVGPIVKRARHVNPDRQPDTSTESESTLVEESDVEDTLVDR